MDTSEKRRLNERWELAGKFSKTPVTLKGMLSALILMAFPNTFVELNNFFAVSSVIITE
jgi:hypothetical protein